MNKTVTNIINTIKFFNWNLTQIWVENNCIYAERIRVNGTKQTEGLYAGSSTDPQNVYNVFNQLKQALNFSNILNDNNVLI